MQHYFTSVKIDSNGIVIKGLAERRLLAVNRTEEGNIDSLLLEGKIISLAEAFRLIGEKSLKISDLIIKKVRHDAKGVIDYLKFDTELILSTLETIQYQKRGLWKVANVILVDSRRRRPYYRTYPDGNTSNNLDNYEEF